MKARGARGSHPCQMHCQDGQRSSTRIVSWAAGTLSGRSFRRATDGGPRTGQVDGTHQEAMPSSYEAVVYPSFRDIVGGCPSQDSDCRLAPQTDSFLMEGPSTASRGNRRENDVRVKRRAGKRRAGKRRAGKRRAGKRRAGKRRAGTSGKTTSGKTGERAKRAGPSGYWPSCRRGSSRPRLVRWVRLVRAKEKRILGWWRSFESGWS